jgi:hypothetical protein
LELLIGGISDHFMSWHVARFASGKEEPAAFALNTNDHRAFCPVEIRKWVDRGRRMERYTPTISGYVFAEGADDAYRWHEIADAEGFLGFINGHDGNPGVVRSVPTRGVDGSVHRTLTVDDILARSEPHDGVDGVTRWVIDWGFDPNEAAELERGAIVRLKALDGAQEGTQALIALAHMLVPELVVGVGVVEWCSAGSAKVRCQGLFGRENTTSVSVAALEEVKVGSKRERASLASLPVKHSQRLTADAM